ncbi:MAG: hypothetical protein IPK26_25745 [Planctomycetes bacterium]|nr:hypothetical protein [Planctomycetota bacterium]
MPAPSLRSPCLLSLLLLGACADGGKEDRPQSDVKIAANHHLYGFRSLRGFGAFPVKPEAAFPDRGTLSMTNDSRYTIIRPAGTTAPDSYAIETNGALSVLVTGGGRDPSVVFRGAYSRTLVAADVPSVFFFTDRVSTTSSPSVGIYYGLPVVNGQVELGGAWHVVSLHTIFAPTSALLSQQRRPGRPWRSADCRRRRSTARAIGGIGTESSNATLTFGGSIQNLLAGSPASGDGTVNLLLNYTAGTSATDTRSCVAAANPDLIFALDNDETDEEAGIVLMMRKFDAGSPAQDGRIAGTFLVGGHTLFVNPTNSGSDAFLGTLTLTAQNGFRLEAVGNGGLDFSYAGTWQGSITGALILTVQGTGETWFAAVSRDYSTVMLIDDQVETRSTGASELNVLLGVRERTGS